MRVVQVQLQGLVDLLHLDVLPLLYGQDPLPAVHVVFLTADGGKDLQLEEPNGPNGTAVKERKKHEQEAEEAPDRKQHLQIFPASFSPHPRRVNEEPFRTNTIIRSELYRTAASVEQQIF